LQLRSAEDNTLLCSNKCGFPPAQTSFCSTLPAASVPISPAFFFSYSTSAPLPFLMLLRSKPRTIRLIKCPFVLPVTDAAAHIISHMLVRPWPIIWSGIWGGGRGWRTSKLGGGHPFLSERIGGGCNIYFSRRERKYVNLEYFWVLLGLRWRRNAYKLLKHVL
jgi:hypothetical protein